MQNQTSKKRIIIGWDAQINRSSMILTHELRIPLILN